MNKYSLISNKGACPLVLHTFINNWLQPLVISITITLLFLLTSVNLFGRFSGGKGTKNEPYLISSKADMEALADSVNNGMDWNTDINWSRNKYFRLINDISEPISTVIGKTKQEGLSFSPISFQGYFDGNNHKLILNMKIDLMANNAYYNIGLFGTTVSSIIENLTVYGYVAGEDNVGGIVGQNGGLIKNCKNYANIDGVGTFIGGIVGFNNIGTIENCKNYGKIDSYEGNKYPSHTDCVGGIVGHNESGKISYCINLATIKSGGAVGGIAGHHMKDTISHCVNIGTVISTSRFAGGITCGDDTNSVVINDSSVFVTNCINAGLVTGKDSVIGGIIGNIPRANYIISNCINTGVVISIFGKRTGGVVGSSYVDGTISNNYYDKQMCVYGGIDGEDIAGQAKGFLTNDMTGDKLKSVLGTEEWIYKDGLYPQLKAFENDTISLIAASPAYLDDIYIDDYDVHKNVRKDFTVNTENNINWSCAFGKVAINNQYAKLLNYGSDTLYAGMGIHRKTIPINIPAEFIIHKVDFGKIIACSDSIIKIIYTNDNNYQLEIRKINFYGKDVNLFSYNDISLPLILNPNESIELLIKFTPLEANIGIKSATIELLTRKPDDERFNLVVHKYELQGEVIQNGITSFRTQIDFGNCITGFIYSNTLVKLSNKTMQAAVIKTAYLINNTDFKLENNLDGVLIPASTNNSITAKILLNAQTNGIKRDTLAIVIKYRNCDDTLKIPIVANLNDLLLTIRASEHKLINPNTKDYEIPIYITSNQNMSNIFIDSIVISIDRNIFYPTNANKINLVNNFYEITLTNIKLPSVVEHVETTLCNIVGDVLLGNVDSSDITIKEIHFSDIIKAEKIDTKNGYITIDICKEGGDRLIDILPYSPSIKVVKNPVSSELETTCKTIELGNYELNIIDLQGNVNQLKIFKMSNKDEHTHNFKFSTAELGNGNYIIEMLTPSQQKFTDKLVIVK